jgi:hypothetical protein
MSNFLQRRRVLIGLIVGFALLAYLIFTAVFYLAFEYTSAGPVPPTPTVAPTFTVTPAVTDAAIAGATEAPVPIATSSPTSAPTLPPVTATPTPIPDQTSSPATVPPASPTPTPTVSTPQIVAASGVNVRGGPGTGYEILGQLPVNQPVPLVGRNADSSWWVITLPDGGQGWVAAAVVSASGPVSTLPVVNAPAPPAPVSPTAAPPTAPPPASFQYEPTGWYADTNYGLTRFLGTITDAGGNPVNGVSVEAQCGDYKVISNPSGPVGRPPFYDSANDPPGFYDITLDTRPIVCNWLLTVVDSPDGQAVTARMSDAIEVETTTESSIVTANWRKNW